MNENGKQIKVAVGLSGGVDSSVAALLLKEQGYEVVGVHMRRMNVEMPGCASDQDRMDALRVAKKLGIAFEVVDFRKEYEEQVIKRFLVEFQAGRTPNPDIWCNEVMKFGLFLDYARNILGANFIATGHYARVSKRNEGDYQLLAGVDSSKDQSYFLYRLNQDQLSRTIFPLGGLNKSEVRRLAEDAGLPTAQKADSVGICFIGEIDLKAYLKKHLQIKTGNVEDVNGKVIGTHEGVQLYTIGQRHGFSVTEYQAEPVYVVKKDVGRNVLVVGRDRVSMRADLNITDLHFIFPEARSLLTDPNVRVRIRHLGELKECTLVDQGGQISCHLHSPDSGIAEGQHAVFYLNELVLGGGVIAFNVG